MATKPKDLPKGIFNEEERFILRDALTSHLASLNRRYLDALRKQSDTRIAGYLKDQIDACQELKTAI